ncbi:L-threonine 3-dehydrogenase, mitochondrial [Armadillidium vulgare]|nr:L-threonine 3-dehydrogenase, mitochondrial [Armadillidium vulgare]
MLTTPEELLKRRTYNVTAMSFTPKELVEEVKKHVPTLTVSYEPDSRQNIANTWPEVFDDTDARKDWGWQPKFDIKSMCETMFQNLRQQQQANNNNRNQIKLSL